VLVAGRRAERLWGEGGPDQLLGSSSRAACLLGGAGPDVLQLGAGGGAAWGEEGDDAASGSPIDDFLEGGGGSDVLDGGAGRDLILPGPGLDGIDAGPGDDVILTADGRAELVQCGAGDDTALADRVDVLIACESLRLEGPPPVRLVAEPGLVSGDEIVRARLRVPAAAGANGYRVLLLAGPGCAAGPVTVASFPEPGRRVRAGRLVRIGLRAPAGGWCPGRVDAAIVLQRPCRAGATCVAPPPAEPVARLSFRSR
jgi:hypothetical protein